MSNADKMFEDLGYKEIKEKSWGIAYTDNCGDEIQFQSDEREVSIDHWGDSVIIDMQELQAINKKAKELGWLDE